jgi:hypothetical protein
LHFLQNLVAPAIWEVIRKAKPFHYHKDDKTLEEAFSEGWIHFSHLLGDHKSFALHGCTELLKVGGAAQTYDNQENMDIGLGVLFGNPETTVIEETNITMLQAQIKNASNRIKVFPDAGKSARCLPVIFLNMQLGVKEVDVMQVIVVESTPKTMVILAQSASPPLMT